MRRKIITLLLLTLFITIIGYSQSGKIKIKTENLSEANYLKMDDFYLTHYLYIDLFLRENLFPEASSEDVSSILKTIKKYVSVENKLNIEIEKPGKTNYLIRIVLLKRDDGTELLIAFTNWNAKRKVFDKEIKIENDPYTRWYFLNGAKMTYRKDMSNQNNYDDMNDSDLANTYLFDELEDNDAKIKSKIDKVLNESNLDISDKIIANLILLKYQIFKREKDNIEKQTNYLSKVFEDNKSNLKLIGLKAAFDATKFQIELMK